MNKELIKELSMARSPSGFEEEIRNVIKKHAEGYDEVKEDNIGNLIFKKGSGSPVVMLDAHMDEIGLMVKYIDENGFLYFTTLGGFWQPTLINQPVSVLGETWHDGVIGSKAPHLMEKDEMEKMPKIHDLFIDVGATNRETVAEMGIKVGSPVVWNSKFLELGNGRFAGKSLDDRLGVYTLLELMRTVDFNGTLLFVFSSQEEVGLKGAKVAAFNLQPDYAVAVDVGHGDSPGIEEKRSQTKLGKGPIITMAEASGRGLIPSMKLNRMLIETATRLSIPYQLEVGESGASNATAIHLQGRGIPTASIGIPLRYMHSPVETFDMADVDNTLKLLSAFLKPLS